ncbi:signal peptidase I [Candidatus Acetothermia bacterium]|nr:signal peptidase I [Candidatus Acetothermia bacterium]
MQNKSDLAILKDNSEILEASIVLDPLDDKSAESPTDGASTATEMVSAEERQTRKPWLARALNRLGIPTTPGVDYILDWVQVLGVAVGITLLTVNYAVARVFVPTGSMEPTIMAGDSFFVDMLTYHLRRPNPGDVIVFWRCENGRCDRLVKRLIAIGGQTVQIKDCFTREYSEEECGVYINGEKPQDPAFHRLYSSGPLGDQIQTVPLGYYFVLGDNTHNSSDSRYWGFVPAKDFIGAPFFRVWPVTRIGFMNGYFWSSR